MFTRQALNASKRSLAATKQVRFNSTAPPAGPRESRLISNGAYILIGAGVAAGGWYYLKGKPSFLIKDLPKKPAEVTLKGDDQWVDLKLIEIHNYNHNTKRFRFALPSEDHISGLHAASAIVTKHQGSDDKKPVIRPYTPVSDEEDRGFLDLLVKKYPGGPMSTHLHDMNIDQSLAFKGPIPKYPWEANKHDHICLIAGGTGITPMYQLARNIFKNKEDKTKVTLVFANISEEDILLKKEFEDLENEFPQRFRAFYVLDSPPKEWAGSKGRITKELLKQVLPEPKNENIKVFVCGPPPMMKAISGPKKSMKEQGEVFGLLKDLGYSTEQVYKF